MVWYYVVSLVCRMALVLYKVFKINQSLTSCLISLSLSMMVLVWCDVVSYGMVFYGMVLLYHTLVWYMVFKINQSITYLMFDLTQSFHEILGGIWLGK